MEQSIDDSVESLYPNDDYMINIPLVIGVIIAILTSLFLAVSYLPSITSTTLQLRTGVIPTLSEEKLNQYRAAVRARTTLSEHPLAGTNFLLICSFNLNSPTR